MANRLVSLVTENSEAAEKLGTLNTKEAILAAVRTYISDYTEEELVNDIQVIQQVQAKEGELDLEQLAEVAGGVNWKSIGSSISSGMSWLISNKDTIISAGNAAKGIYGQLRG